MKVLVTGGLGLIGHRVVHSLEARGHSVTIIDSKNNYNGLIPQKELDTLHQERLATIKTRDIHYVDIRNGNQVNQVMEFVKPKIVIDLGTNGRQHQVREQPIDGTYTMTIGPINVLEACVKQKVRRYVFASAPLVYGQYESNVKEDAPKDPYSIFGVWKLANEYLAKDYSRRFGLEYTICRLSQVYGPRDFDTRNMSRLCTAAFKGGVLRVKGNDVIDHTYVDDAAEGMVMAALSEIGCNKIYNITASEPATYREAAELVVKVAGQGTIEMVPPDPEFAGPRGPINCDLARSELGWEPKTTLEQGIKNIFSWLNSSTYWKTQSLK
jgi:UDP-glucose 4-epimerase